MENVDISLPMKGACCAALTSLMLLPIWPVGQQPKQVSAVNAAQVRVNATVSRAEEDSLCKVLISSTGTVHSEMNVVRNRNQLDLR